MDGDLGLRERKKARTRQLIVETATMLFVEKGFDAVPVAEIARAAEVSEATVFNYFPTKEDLVYQGMEAFEAELLATIRDRPPGESITGAFARFALHPRGLLAAEDEDSARTLAGTSKMIAASPTLLTREREMIARYTASLAALIAEDTAAGPDDLAPWAVAHALMGIHHSLISLVRRRLLAGETDHTRLARAVKTHGRTALRLVDAGLADYGVRGSSGAGSPPRRGGHQPGPGRGAARGRTEASPEGP